MKCASVSGLVAGLVLVMESTGFGRADDRRKSGSAQIPVHSGRNGTLRDREQGGSARDRSAARGRLPRGQFSETRVAPDQTVAQKDFAFLPPLLAIQVGTKVEFPNQDDTYHNIFSYSPPKRFDLGRYPSGVNPVPSVVFDKPGLVTLRCDIHEHMRGLILVLDTPYFVLTDAQGRFRLTNLPAGHFLLKAWLDSRTSRERPVELTSGAILHADLP